MMHNFKIALGKNRVVTSPHWKMVKSLVAGCESLLTLILKTGMYYI